MCVCPRRDNCKQFSQICNSMFLWLLLSACGCPVLHRLRLCYYNIMRWRMDSVIRFHFYPSKRYIVYRGIILLHIDCVASTELSRITTRDIHGRCVDKVNAYTSEGYKLMDIWTLLRKKYLMLFCESCPCRSGRAYPGTLHVDGIIATECWTRYESARPQRLNTPVQMSIRTQAGG